jgi:DNA-binding FadR family transcriptional regulator
VDLDIEFHRTLVEISASRFLVQAWLALAPGIHTVITVGNRRLAVRDPRFHYERIVASHRPLVDAIAALDAEQATALLGEQFGFTKSMFTADAGET